jgi:hypothetical protein
LRRAISTLSDSRLRVPDFVEIETNLLATEILSTGSDNPRDWRDSIVKRNICTAIPAIETT